MTANNEKVAEGGRLDRIGMVASCVCAVHCALMPIVFGVLSLLGLGVLTDESAEWMLISVTIVVGAASLVPSNLQHHRRAKPLVLFACGVGCVLVGRLLFEDNAVVETLAVFAGALLIAVAHSVNRRLCRVCCEVVDEKTAVGRV